MHNQSVQYQQNVGVVLYNGARHIFLGRRVHGGWSMPQGGMEYGESVIECGKRELQEETGLKNITDIVEIPETFSYMIPNTMSGKAQRWIVARWLGNEPMRLDTDQHIEFDAYEWCSMDAVLARCVYFKKHIYKRVLGFTQHLFESA